MSDKEKEKEKEKMEILYEDLDKDNSKKKTKSNLIVVYIIIGLILIGLAIFLILHYKKGKNNKPITKLTHESLKNIKTPFYFYNTTLLGYIDAFRIFGIFGIFCNTTFVDD